jgi:hypothetical protein
MSQPYRPSTPTPEPHAITLRRLRRISHVLDNAIPIPGTRYRIGLDPILGLLPGGGDLAGAILSAYIVFSAAQIGASRETLLQMVWNILLETFAGTVPVLGDIFDVAWKANVKNIELLEQHLHLSPTTTQKVEGWFVWLLIIGLLLVVLLVVSIGVFLISQVIQLLLGN